MPSAKIVERPARFERVDRVNARRGASCRLAGWGGMGVIYGVLLGLFVLWSRRDGLPFGDAEQQARATGSGEG